MLAVYGLYGHIHRNTQKSALLLACFTALIAVAWYAWCIIYCALVDGWLPHMANAHAHRHATSTPSVAAIFGHATHLALIRWWVPLVVAACWIVVAFMVYADMIRLATGARPITRQEAPKLYNAVETLAIAAGLPMPRVEIILSNARNAFASGLGPDDACITVTSGLMRALTPDELEAVLAHEMTHIKNGDIRLMVVATVVAGGLTLVGDGIARLLQGPQQPAGGYNSSYYDYTDALPNAADKNDRTGRAAASLVDVIEAESGSPIAIVISLAIAVLFLAMAHVSALMIKFALSRSREFLADAGAVTLTRNPDALIAALEKIASHDDIPGLNRNMQALMISARVSGLFATHPPMASRIVALQRYAGGRTAVAPRRLPQRPVTAVGTLGVAGGRSTFGRRGAVGV